MTTTELILGKLGWESIPLHEPILIATFAGELFLGESDEGVSIPEPESLLLLSVGVFGLSLFGLFRLRRKASRPGRTSEFLTVSELAP